MFIIGAAEMLMIILIVASVTFMFVVPALKRRALIDKPKRQVIGDDGEVVVVTPRTRAKPFKQSGKGAFASDALTLYSGVYRVEYRFPPGAPVTATLINIENKGEIPVISKAGVGSHALRLPRNGRYVLNIDPSDETLAWEIELKQL